MANNLKSNPIVIDTISGDTVVSTAPLKLFLVELYAAGGAGVVLLKDTLGDAKAVFAVGSSGGCDRQEWHYPLWVNDLVIDGTATFPAGSRLLIYV